MMGKNFMKFVLRAFGFCTSIGNLPEIDMALPELDLQ